MALARVYDAAHGPFASSLHDGYRDRLARWSDIQEYMPYLYDCACSYPQVRVLELGTRKGNSTLAFLAAAEKTGGHVWSADITDVTRDVAGMRSWSQNRYWTFICGDDMDEAVQARLPAEVDVLFLDTSHEYDATMTELAAYLPRLADGGTALFHDTNVHSWPGYEPPTELPPVRQALNDYCKETGLSWRQIPGTYGLGEIGRGCPPETAGTDRDRPARLGQPAAPRNVPAGLGQGRGETR